MADKNLLHRHEEYLEEFLSADKYVFVNPMYNGFVTAELKQYIDVIAVPRKLFRYTENGPIGLLEGKNHFISNPLAVFIIMNKIQPIWRMI